LDFAPHTPDDDRVMLETVGLDAMDELFEAIDSSMQLSRPLGVPEALDEVELLDHLAALAARSRGPGELLCFAGGGSYDHHLPPVVKALAGRAEFATSYTPYQPELSQGVLQAIYEFQTLVCELYGMEVANASLYDGANALVEAVTLSMRTTKRSRVLVGATVHPHYVQVLRTYTSGLDLDIEVVPFNEDGVVDWSGVDATDAAAVACAYPNFFGRLEALDVASDVAHAAGALSIAVTDPTAMGVLESPGALGADLAVGEGQGLGNPKSYGGPYVGLFATKLEHVRQVPGRIAGETVDADGRRAYVLTLQAREQHIRRAKATSNVCTNQTLMAIFASVYLGWLGPEGLRHLGQVCVRRTAFAAQRLSEIPGCEVAFKGAHFKELVLRTPVEARALERTIAERGYLAGPSLGRWWPELGDCLLVAVTERRTEQDIVGLAEAIEKELAG